MMLATLKKGVKSFLSDLDVSRITLGQVPIISYHQLDELPNEYNAIEDLFILPNGRESKAVIILYENTYNTGHYCALIKTKKGLEFFDPYGGKHKGIGGVDEELKFSNYNKKNNHIFLKGLVSNSKYKNHFYTNPYDFQMDKSGVNTCGRWSGARCRLSHLPLEVFHKLFLVNPIMPPDLMITAMTLLDTI